MWITFDNYFELAKILDKFLDEAHRAISLNWSFPSLFWSNNWSWKRRKIEKLDCGNEIEHVHVFLYLMWKKRTKLE